MKTAFKLILLIIFTTSVAFAAPEGKKTVHKDRSDLPINIKSNNLDADNKGRIAVFTGKVVAKHDDVTIFCDKMTVYYGENQGDVEKIEADGNVRIVQDNKIGTSSHATYETKQGLITLTINPKVMQGTDTVTGKIITYYVDEDRSVVTSGGDTRVISIIHPKAKKNDAAKGK